MEKTDLFELINKTTDKNKLIDMFYDNLNSFDDDIDYVMDHVEDYHFKPLKKLEVSVHLANKINSFDCSNDKDKLKQFEINLELRNLYIFCLSQLEGLRIELINKKHYDKEMVDNTMKSKFDLISKATNYDKETREYISKEMVKDCANNIFPEIDIEEEIHKKFNTKDKFKNNGIRNSIIDIIYKFDPMLSDYIAVNPNILDEISDKQKEYLDDFDIYDDKRKYKFLMREVKDYCFDKNLDYNSYLLRLSAEYNIFNKIIKYSPEYKESNYVELKEYVISEARNDKDDNYENLRKIFEKYTKEFGDNNNIVAFKKGI